MSRDIEVVYRIFKEVKNNHKSLHYRDDLDMAQFVNIINQVLTSTMWQESSRDRMIKAMTLILHQIYVRDLEDRENSEPDWFIKLQEEIENLQRNEPIDSQVEPRVFTFGCCECDNFGNCNGSCK